MSVITVDFGLKVAVRMVFLFLGSQFNASLLGAQEAKGLLLKTNAQKIRDRRKEQRVAKKVYEKENKALKEGSLENLLDLESKVRSQIEVEEDQKIKNIVIWTCARFDNAFFNSFRDMYKREMSESRQFI